MKIRKMTSLLQNDNRREKQEDYVTFVAATTDAG